MFRILILQRFYNLSDDQTEYQIPDRLFFMRFLDLTLNDRVPDSKTIWHFREQLINESAIERLFKKFVASLDKHGILIHEGKIVDASFVEVPRQRNNRDENSQLKAGQIPDKWADNPNKLSQKDIDARWTKKNNVSYYGYKDHVKIDGKNYRSYRLWQKFFGNSVGKSGVQSGLQNLVHIYEKTIHSVKNGASRRYLSQICRRK